MINPIMYAAGRYAGFLSHVAAFLAGLGLVLPLSFGLCCLALAVILDSLSSWCSRHYIGYL